MLLALDTSTQYVGLALFDGVQIYGETVWQTRGHHTVEVVPALKDLYQRCGIQPADIEAIAVALGPGSFTSLRIGLAVAKGLALAGRIPLIGVPTLDILAAAQPLKNLPLVVLLHAGRGRLAAGLYQVGRRGWESQGEAYITTADALFEGIQSPTIVCGELNASERQILNRNRKLINLASPAQSLRRPSFLAEIGFKRWRAGRVDEVVQLAPIYLHTSEAIPA
jgi:tRNA threonylcarbamoyladenosine biosynthesis protein TsaB